MGDFCAHTQHTRIMQNNGPMSASAGPTSPLGWSDSWKHRMVCFGLAEGQANQWREINSCEEGWTVMGASIVLVFISVQSWFQTYSLSISNHPYIVYQIYKDSVRSSKRKVAKRMMTKSSVLNIQAVPGKWRKRKAQVGFVWLVVPTTAPLLHPLRLWLVVSPRPYRLPSLCQASNINRWKYKEFHKSKCENISEHFPAKYFVFPCRDLIWLQN